MKNNHAPLVFGMFQHTAIFYDGPIDKTVHFFIGPIFYRKLGKVDNSPTASYSVRPSGMVNEIVKRVGGACPALPPTHRTLRLTFSLAYSPYECNVAKRNREGTERPCTPRTLHSLQSLRANSYLLFIIYVSINFGLYHYKAFFSPYGTESVASGVQSLKIFDPSCPFHSRQCVSPPRLLFVDLARQGLVFCSVMMGDRSYQAVGNGAYCVDRMDAIFLADCL